MVVLPETREEFQASVAVLDQRSGVAVLGRRFSQARACASPPRTRSQSRGTALPPRFAPDGTLDERSARGSISELRIIEPTAVGERDVLLYRHNALATARQYGMPLLNDCGEAVGQLRTDPGMSRTTLNARPDPGPAPFGAAAAAVRDVLTEAGAEPRFAEEPCLDPSTAAEAARQAAAAAAARADAAAAEARDGWRGRDVAREEPRWARTAAEQSQAEREAAEAEAGRLARQRRWSRGRGNSRSGGGRRRRSTAVKRLRRRGEALSASEEALKDAFHPAGFSCLLDGADESGRGYALKVSAEQLGSPTGRSWQKPGPGQALLDPPGASREHFRLTARGDELFVTDPPLTNGTFVNGERLGAGAEAAVADGAEIGVGSAIALRLKIQQTDQRPTRREASISASRRLICSLRRSVRS